MGEFREIAYNPTLQNSVATVRKSSQRTQHNGRCPTPGGVSFTIAAGVC